MSERRSNQIGSVVKRVQTRREDRDRDRMVTAAWSARTGERSVRGKGGAVVLGREEQREAQGSGRQNRERERERREGKGGGAARVETGEEEIRSGRGPAMSGADRG